MDRSAIEQLQMHGQDIPWLLGHWADKKPEHPALIWEPVEDEGRTWTEVSTNHVDDTDPAQVQTAPSGHPGARSPVLFVVSLATSITGLHHANADPSNPQERAEPTYASPTRSGARSRS